MSEPRLALSIRQPWAWLIVNGFKDVENRSWTTRFRGAVLIHAGQKIEREYLDVGDWPWRALPRPYLTDLPLIDAPSHFEAGGIVGEAEIVDCVTTSSSPWFYGPYGFVLRNARPLPFRPCRGRLGFFPPDFTPPAPKLPKPTKIDPQGLLFGGAHA